MNQDRIELAINENITLKKTDKDTANEDFSAYGWVNKSISWDMLSGKKPLELVKTYGMTPFSFKAGESRKVWENIDKYHSIMIDLEGEKTNFSKIKEEVVDNLPYTCLMFTSVNHMKLNPPGHRVRIWIPYLEPLDKQSQLRLEPYFINIFRDYGIDTSCFKKSRYFFPSSCALNYFHKGTNLERFIPQNIVKPDVQDHEEEEKEKESESTKLLKREYFNLKDIVILKDSMREVSIESLVDDIVKVSKDAYKFNYKKISIVCKYCDPLARKDPKKSNSFLTKSNTGNIYQHCSSEARSRFLDPKEYNNLNWNLFFNKDIGKKIHMREMSDRIPFKVMNNDEEFFHACEEEGLSPKIKPHLKSYSMEFTPGKDTGPNGDLYNIWQKSSLIEYGEKNKIPEEDANLKWLEKNCSIYYNILKHLFSNNREINFFLNWVAFIIRKHVKLHHYLVISSCPGTGKDEIFKAIAKIISPRYLQITKGKNLGEKFNSGDATLIFKIFNEFVTKAMSPQTRASKLSDIKSMTTDTLQGIEAKGHDKIWLDSWCNYIVLSNELDFSFTLDQIDRRATILVNNNAIPVSEWYHKNRNSETSWEDFAEELERDLKSFTVYLHSIKLNSNMAHTPMNTDAKIRMQSVSLAENNLDYFKVKLEKLDWEGLDIIGADYGYDEEPGIDMNGGRIFRKKINPEDVLALCILYEGIPEAHYTAIIQHWFKNDVPKNKAILREMKVIRTNTKKSNGNRFYKVKIN